MSGRRHDGVLSRGILFGLGFAGLGGMSLAGSKNWFELLNTTQTKFEKRKMASDYHWIKIIQERNSQKIVEGKSSKNTKKLQRARSHAKAMQIPEIEVTDWDIIDSVGSSDLSMSLESTDENEFDDCEDFVYECPGLAASAEDMTVENPLFNEKLFQKCYRTPELPKRFWKDVFTETI